MEPNEKKDSIFSTKFIRFLGGKNLVFMLAVLLLLGCVIFVFGKVDYVFKPLRVLLSTIMLPVILAGILYYLMRPILRKLEKWGIKRIWGILLLLLIAGGIIALLIGLVFPFLRDQLTNLAKDFPDYYRNFVASINHFIEHSRFSKYLQDFDFDFNMISDKLSGDLGTSIKDTVTGAVQGFASGITSIVSTVTGLLLHLATVPFILFYLLKDGEKLPKYILNMFPPRARKEIHSVLHDMDDKVSSYIQGQLIVSFCIGVMVTIGFLIIGMDYAVLLGALAMVTSVVPYLGPIIAITPAVIIALVTSPVMLLKLAVVWTVVQLIEGKFISPQVMGHSLAIHPITIIFVLLTAGSLFGVPGVVLGIPGYAVLKVLVTHLFAAFKIRYNRFSDKLDDKYEV
ncbi:AI-2E family transporter [Lysinibacillus alkalisoli]|uniref:AI-2E family transporter n=1 Tax=Lysinibacillus alkalisoli TaxID=1911548 RepID=A0A917G0I8_9BACI|nr:AI-2E family transporter [Lysinibacillus alkalisoli]GGG15951.1 AI-2E family transporter [Lysinibacillus alkalisoli]